MSQSHPPGLRPNMANEQDRQHNIQFLKMQAETIRYQIAPITKRRDLSTTLASEARANSMIASSKFGVALVTYLDNEAAYHQSNVMTLETNLQEILNGLAHLDRMIVSVPAGGGGLKL